MALGLSRSAKYVFPILTFARAYSVFNDRAFVDSLEVNTTVARGIYFIRVIGPDFDEMRKVIVEK